MCNPLFFSGQEGIVVFELQNMVQVLTCYAQMAGGIAEDIDAALNKLLEVAGQGTESVPLLLALASGFMLKQQTPKGR